MIKIENLSFGYKKQKLLYDDLSLEVKSGSIVGLLGKNGAGKTTLLKLITGLLRTNNNKSIKVLTQAISERNPSLLQEIFSIPEELDLPAVTIKNYLSATTKYYPRFNQEKLEKILNEFELSKENKLDKLSLGQSKKFIIAMALASGCKLLIFDEPTNGLDIPSKSTFRKVMAGSLEDDQLVIISTHQVKDIEILIDHVIIVNEGKVVLDKSIFELSNDFSFKAVKNLEDYNCLYSEATIGGHKIITNRNGEETEVDIETLFNAIISGNQLY